VYLSALSNHMERPCEHGNEPSSSLQGLEFLTSWQTINFWRSLLQEKLYHLISLISIIILSFLLRLHVPSYPFTSWFSTKFCVNCSSLPIVLHASTISFSFIVSLWSYLNNITSWSDVTGVGIAQSLQWRGTGWMTGVRFLAGAISFSSLHSVQIDYGFHPNS
jgi:hypothetical protein